MFERFTRAARDTVTAAQREARDLHHLRIGTEHLLLGLLDQSTSPVAAVLVAHGLTRAAVVEAIVAHVGGTDLDADALTTLGIDLDAVRDRVEATFGTGALDGRPRSGTKGHIPFTPRAKKVIELSLREAMALKQKTITDGHIALGLLREGQGLAMKIIADRGVDPFALRQEISGALLS